MFYTFVNDLVTRSHQIDAQNLAFNRANNAAMQNGFPSNYQGLTVSSGFGKGNWANITWIGFLYNNQTIQNGIYPVYLYYRKIGILVLAYGLSETHSPALTWALPNQQTIAQYFKAHNLGPATRYNNSLVYKVYNMNHIKELDSNADQDLDFLLNYYKQYMSSRTVAPVSQAQTANKTKVFKLNDLPLQRIYFGAPGTGKSHEIKAITKGESVVRTTFHPDSDYSSFVGCYKPTMIEEKNVVVPVIVNTGGISLDHNNGTFFQKRISYKFVIQAFLKAYLGAWKMFSDPDNGVIRPQFLIIEEINRGNCAQVFGDLFQLLDRNEKGFSEYPIEADTDLQQEIENSFHEMNGEYKLVHDIDADEALDDYTSNSGHTLSEDIQHGRVLLLPPNFFIWATMNTSDQSLFPIDSAFKRRWDWTYIPIEDARKEWKIDINGNMYDWSAFLSAINSEVFELTHSEDKQLGYYFVKAKNGIIDAESLVNKVFFYLWTDVFKDYDYESLKAFRKGTGNEAFSFKDFFKGRQIDVVSVEQVIKNLGI